MQQITIHVTVNDEAYTRTVPVNMTLLQFLREELHLTGTKEGCDEGECGACTVLVDGHPMNSCLVLVAELDGKHVLTVEGLARDGRLHPLQEAFLEVGAVQCGYCTPGMLLSGIALLNLYPHPTREQIRKEMEGNICRCTGYARIADAYFAREITRETLDALPKRYTAAERAEAVFAQREATERALYRYLFGEYARRCPVQYQAPEFLAGTAAAGSPEAFAERIFSGVWEGSDTTAVNTLARGAKRMQDHIEWLLGTRSLRNLNSARLNELYTAYIKGLREWDAGRAFFPDANLTLRVAYGHVAGYEYADGEYHKPRTTIDGIIAKDNPDIYDYDIPQALRDIHASKEYGRWATRIDGRTTVPVCFLATNHTTGGNSGSPILNARGELVGVNFDRTWRSTMSDVAFDETICRNIAVDIRYVLFVIDRIGGAGYLFGEMDFGKRK